jgi:MFS transporter, FSR family, fosmidomycin resistance protein
MSVAAPHGRRVHPAELSGAPDRLGLSLLAGGHFVVDMCVGAIPALIPLFTAAFVLSDFESAMILGVSTFASSAMQPLFGLVADRRAAPWLLWGGVAVAAAGFALAGLAGGYLLVLACILASGW